MQNKMLMIEFPTPTPSAMAPQPLVGAIEASQSHSDTLGLVGVGTGDEAETST